MSNDAGFVKGPWSIDPLGIGTPWNVGTIADDIALVAPLVADRDNAIRAANARLIAAAPDLYEALAALVAEWEAERFEWSENRPEVLGLAVKQPWTGSTIINAARAALAKANGSTQTEATEDAGQERLSL